MTDEIYTTSCCTWTKYYFKYIVNRFKNNRLGLWKHTQKVNCCILQIRFFLLQKFENFSGTFSRAFFLNMIYPNMCHYVFYFSSFKIVFKCSTTINIFHFCFSLEEVSDFIFIALNYLFWNYEFSDTTPKIINLKLCSTSFLSSFLFVFFYLISVFAAFLLL